MLKQLYILIIRWIIASSGLWITTRFLDAAGNSQNRIAVIIIAGLILAIINAIIKPILIIFSLPVILFTLGIFMVIINGATVLLVGRLYPSLHINNFWTAIFAGIVIGLLNYLISTLLEEKY